MWIENQLNVLLDPKRRRSRSFLWIDVSLDLCLEKRKSLGELLFGRFRVVLTGVNWAIFSREHDVKLRINGNSYNTDGRHMCISKRYFPEIPRNLDKLTKIYRLFHWRTGRLSDICSGPTSRASIKPGESTSMTGKVRESKAYMGTWSRLFRDVAPAGRVRWSVRTFGSYNLSEPDGICPALIQRAKNWPWGPWWDWYGLA